MLGGEPGRRWWARDWGAQGWRSAPKRPAPELARATAPPLKAPKRPPFPPLTQNKPAKPPAHAPLPKNPQNRGPPSDLVQRDAAVHHGAGGPEPGCRHEVVHVLVHQPKRDGLVAHKPGGVGLGWVGGFGGGAVSLGCGWNAMVLSPTSLGGLGLRLGVLEGGKGCGRGWSRHPQGWGVGLGVRGFGVKRGPGKRSSGAQARACALQSPGGEGLVGRGVRARTRAREGARPASTHAWSWLSA